MAKSSRSSTRKTNNQRLKKNVFGPIEAARQQRLSARLLELAAQPKPVPEKTMEDVAEPVEAEDTKTATEDKTDDAMELDLATKSQSKPKKKIDKRRGKKSNIAFRKYGDKATGRKRK